MKILISNVLATLIAISFFTGCQSEEEKEASKIIAKEIVEGERLRNLTPEERKERSKEVKQNNKEQWKMMRESMNKARE